MYSVVGFLHVLRHFGTKKSSLTSLMYSMSMPAVWSSIISCSAANRHLGASENFLYVCMIAPEISV